MISKVQDYKSSKVSLQECKCVTSRVQIYVFKSANVRFQECKCITSKIQMYDFKSTKFRTTSLSLFRGLLKTSSDSRLGSV
jgi:hypothetical protein